MKKKSIALLMALVLVVGLVTGGTLAWLTTKTDPIKNTFTAGNVKISLAEETKNFVMVPGTDIKKDPKVTVKKDSVKSYLFVKLEKSKSFNGFLSYEVRDDWTALPNVADVYYRVVENSDQDQSFYVLKDNKVHVSDTVSKKMMDELTPATTPTLTVTAYACQWDNGTADGFTPNGAWAEVPKN